MNAQSGQHLPAGPGNELTKGRTRGLRRTPPFPQTRNSCCCRAGTFGVVGPSPLIFQMKGLTAHFTKTSRSAALLTGLPALPLCPEPLSSPPSPSLSVSQHRRLARETYCHTGQGGVLPGSSAPRGTCLVVPAGALGGRPRHCWNPSSVLSSRVTSGKSDNLKASVSTYIKWE